MIYAIRVHRADGSELTGELASHPAIDAGRVEGVPVGSLSVLTPDECRVALGQIIDMGHEWGAVPDTHIEGLHARAATIVDSGFRTANFEVPDGWRVYVYQPPETEVQDTIESLVRGARDAFRADNVTDAFGHLTRAVGLLTGALDSVRDELHEVASDTEDAASADTIERLERDLSDLDNRVTDLEA